MPENRDYIKILRECLQNKISTKPSAGLKEYFGKPIYDVYCTWLDYELIFIKIAIFQEILMKDPISNLENVYVKFRS